MKGTDESRAREIAARYFAARFGDRGTDVVVTSVREIDIGWLITYQSKAYIDTHDDNHLLLGNGPLVVDRTGVIHATGTSLPASKYINRIRKELET
jgi:Immunity protein 35